MHDDLVQWGGAERVLLAISGVFPEAPIFTIVFDRSNKILAEKFKGKKIITSFIQQIPGWRNFFKATMPLHPLAFEQFDFTDFDLVISHTTRFAKGIVTKPQTKHISYIHTPPRFLWNFSGEKTPKILNPYLSFLKIYDRISSQRVDEFLAGSENARKRIKKVYKRESKVLYPFVDIDKVSPEDSFDGGYFLVVSRLNKYKRVDLAVEEFKKNGLRLKIVGVGPELCNLKKESSPNIEFLEDVSEEMLVNLMSGCKALIVTAEEDFGLTPLEAQACGKSVIAYGAGGALETVVEGKTGVFFYEQSANSLHLAIQKLENSRMDGKDCRENAGKFSKQNFQNRLKELI